MSHLSETARDAAERATDERGMAYAQVLAALAIAESVDQLTREIEHAGTVAADATTKAAIHLGGSGII